MQPVEVMQKAIDIGAVAERYLVAGDLDGAAVLTSMADMYVGMARELRIGNLRMTRPSRGGTVTPVYHDTLIRKTVTWDPQEPAPAPEPYSGEPTVDEPLAAAPAPVEGASESAPVVDDPSSTDPLGGQV